MTPWENRRKKKREQNTRRTIWIGVIIECNQIRSVLSVQKVAFPVRGGEGVREDGDTIVIINLTTEGGKANTQKQQTDR
jgi:hypothetical protein